MGFHDYWLNQLRLNDEVERLRAAQVARAGKQEIKAIRANIQAISEGGRSILTTAITQYTDSMKESDKNKYTNYSAQVAGAYKMYNGTADYGGDLLGGCLDIRAAMVAGEGISLSAEKEATQKYLDKFSGENDLDGLLVLRFAELCELEGKGLLVLSKNPAKKIPRLSYVSWQMKKYEVEASELDDVPTSITYKKNDKTVSVPIKLASYVRVGGCPTDLNETPGRIHRLLTDFENASRAKYDLNKNTRLFGKVIPTWETVDDLKAKAIKKQIDASDFQIGRGFAGPAKMSLLEPTGAASGAIEKLVLMYFKVISAGTGIPIHWIAWPELMSNRATAENLTEVINAATKKERMAIERGIKEIVEKSMDLAIDEGYEENAIKGEFEVKLPFVSIEMLKSILEVYLPLEQEGLFSRKTLRDITPLGLNWRQEDKQIEREKKRAAKNAPEQNHTVNDALAAARAGQGGQIGEEQGEGALDEAAQNGLE